MSSRVQIFLGTVANPTRSRYAVEPYTLEHVLEVHLRTSASLLSLRSVATIT